MTTTTSARTGGEPTRRAVLRAFSVGSAPAAAGKGGALVAAQDATPGAPATGGPPPGGSDGSGGPPGGNEEEALAEPFVGVTTDGRVVPGLFPVESTGASTSPVVAAAQAFGAALSEEQRAAIFFAVDDPEWRKRSKVDGYRRQGVSPREMDDAQAAAAMGPLAATLSAAGFDKVDATMKLNHAEGGFMDDFEGFDEELYGFTVMGESSEAEPWGWQIDGHHLAVAWFALGDQVVMTPVFMGAEPTVAPEGADDADLSVLLPEQDKGLACVNALTDDQRAVAIRATEKTGIDMVAGAFPDSAIVPYAGVTGADLDDGQRARLLDLVAEYVGTTDDGHAAVKMDEARAHLDETRFAGIGETGPEAVVYYRIQSPMVLIEFDHQPSGPLGRASDYCHGATGPQRAHVHTVIRTPNGNDDGKDLLADHDATSPHHGAERRVAAAAAGAS